MLVTLPRCKLVIFEPCTDHACSISVACHVELFNFISYIVASSTELSASSCASFCGTRDMNRTNLKHAFPAVFLEKYVPATAVYVITTVFEESETVHLKISWDKVLSFATVIVTIPVKTVLSKSPETRLNILSPPVVHFLEYVAALHPDLLYTFHKPKSHCFISIPSLTIPKDKNAFLFPVPLFKVTLFKLILHLTELLLSE